MQRPKSKWSRGQRGSAFLWVMALASAGVVLAYVAQQRIQYNLQEVKRYTQTDDLCDLMRYINFRADCARTITNKPSSCPADTKIDVYSTASTALNGKAITIDGTRKFGTYAVRAACLATPPNKFEIQVRSDFDLAQRKLQGDANATTNAWKKLFILDCSPSHDINLKCKQLMEAL